MLAAKVIQTDARYLVTLFVSTLAFSSILARIVLGSALFIFTESASKAWLARAFGFRMNQRTIVACAMVLALVGPTQMYIAFASRVILRASASGVRRARNAGATVVTRLVSLAHLYVAIFSRVAMIAQAMSSRVLLSARMACAMFAFGFTCS